MKDSLRWAYGFNQWNYRLDIFVRHEEQQRALQTCSVLGFDHIELTSGTGRWDNIARPEVILLNHGSHQGFLDFLGRAAVKGISSLVWDPNQPVEEEGWAFRMVRNPADHDGIVESAKPMIDFLAGAGGEQLVARTAGSAWMAPPIAEADFAVIGELWNRVGELARAAGVGLSLNYDCLSPVHTVDHLEKLLDATDPDLVGLTVDTAEHVIGGIDPVAFYAAHHDRISHVQLKDTRYADTGSEYLTPGAESTMLKGGAGRRIERWFYELGTEGGLVDVPTFVAQLREHAYAGWVVVESDGGGNAAELAMLNSWYLQHELGLTRS